MKESHRMLREAQDHESLDFVTPTSRAMPFDGDDAGDHSAAMEAIFAQEDERYRQFYMPLIDEQIVHPGSSLTGRSLVDEITEAELDDTLPHYTTPIGRLPQRVRKARPLTKAQFTKAHNERMQERQTALRARQKHNDRVLDSLIKRMF